MKTHAKGVYGCAFLMILLIMACDSSPVADDKSDNMLNSGPEALVMSSNTDHNFNVMLADIRSATAKYHKVSVAMEEGFELASPFLPNMGYHYVNFKRVDKSVEITKPEALVYITNPTHKDKHRLVAVEYLIPKALISEKSDLPDVFPGDLDHWHLEEELGLWTLHLWLWYHNPDGLFNGTNPRVGTE